MLRGKFVFVLYWSSCASSLLALTKRWPAGYLSRSGYPCVAGTQVGRGRGQAHSGVASCSRNKAAWLYSPCSTRKLAKMSGHVKDGLHPVHVPSWEIITRGFFIAIISTTLGSVAPFVVSDKPLQFPSE